MYETASMSGADVNIRHKNTVPQWKVLEGTSNQLIERSLSRILTLPLGAGPLDMLWRDSFVMVGCLEELCEPGHSV